MNEKLSIWLIDDDDITKFLCLEIIKQNAPHAEVTSLSNGEVAYNNLLQLVEENKALPDVLLLDVNMPLMDGWEFLDKIEESGNDAFNKLNIFMLTSSVYFEDAARAESNKLVKSIITKPLSAEGVMKMMRSVN